jgi:hypothetical protein
MRLPTKPLSEMSLNEQLEELIPRKERTTKRRQSRSEQLGVPRCNVAMLQGAERRRKLGRKPIRFTLPARPRP